MSDEDKEMAEALQVLRNKRAGLVFELEKVDTAIRSLEAVLGGNVVQFRPATPSGGRGPHKDSQRQGIRNLFYGNESGLTAAKIREHFPQDNWRTVYSNINTLYRIGELRREGDTYFKTSKMKKR